MDPTRSEEAGQEGTDLEEQLLRSSSDPQTVQDADGARHGSTSWPMTCSIMVAEMLGIGALSMPSAFARLGWIDSFAVIALSGAGMAFSGVLYSKLGLRIPKARAFDELGSASYGRAGRVLIYSTVYIAIFGAPMLLHLTAAESLQQIFEGAGLSNRLASLIILAIIIPLSQIRGLEHVSVLSLLGTLGMLTALAVACVKLLLMPSEQPSPVHPEPDHAGPMIMLIALCNIIFAYDVIIPANWVSYMAPMRDRGQFKQATALASALMTACFVAMGAIGYYKLGTHFDQTQPITTALHSDRLWAPIMNAGLLAHCILAYQIDLNVWARTLLHLAWPEFAEPVPSSAPASQRRASVLVWGGTSAAGALLAFSIASLLPYFSTVMGLVAAIGDVSAAYLLPSLFCLKLLPERLSPLQRGLCWVLVPVSVLLSVAGTWASGSELLAQIRHDKRT